MFSGKRGLPARDFHCQNRFVSFSPPAKEGIGLDDRQGRLPVEQPRPQQEGEAGCIAEPSWPDFVFLVKRQLLAEKEILGG
jgi:hypothetical protein